MRSTSRLAARLSRLAALAGAVAFAVCGVKGPPRPPLSEEEVRRDAGPIAGCQSLEAPELAAATIAQGLCDACAELREKRRRCGLTGPTGGRCDAECPLAEGQPDGGSGK